MPRKFTAEMEPSKQNREMGVPGSRFYTPGLPAWLPDPRKSPFIVDIREEDGGGRFSSIVIEVRSRVTGSRFAIDAKDLHLSSRGDPQVVLSEVVAEMTAKVKDSMIADFGLQGHIDERIRRDHATDLHQLLTLIGTGELRDVHDIRSWLVEKLHV